MKFVKVTALAAAMAASFGANAELAALEDEALESVTGQAGITVEQSLGGMEIYYVDDDGIATNLEGGGAHISLETVVYDNTAAAGSQVTQGGSITMVIDVVDGTPGSATTDALAITQSMSANTYLHASVDFSSVTNAASAGNVAFEEVLGNAAGASIGDIYVDMGTTTMYVYGH